MKSLVLTAAALLLASSAQAADVVVTPVLRSTVTVTGQPIVLPRDDAEVVVSTYEIAPGAALPEHKHPYPRYAHVLAGTLSVTNTETGKVVVFKPGDFIVEAIGQWHRGANIGGDPVRLLVIDQVERGRGNVIPRP